MRVTLCQDPVTPPWGCPCPRASLGGVQFPGPCSSRLGPQALGWVSNSIFVPAPGQRWFPPFGSPGVHRSQGTSYSLPVTPQNGLRVEQTDLGSSPGLALASPSVKWSCLLPVPVLKLLQGFGEAEGGSGSAVSSGHHGHCHTILWVGRLGSVYFSQTSGHLRSHTMCRDIG